MLVSTILLPAGAGARTVAERVADQSYADEDLDSSRSLVDSRLAGRLQNIEKAGASLQEFQAQMKKEQAEFERRAAEEEKAFLLYMKSANPDDRAMVFREFLERQAKKRLAFDKDAFSKQKAWFDENIAATWKTASIDSEPAGIEPSGPSIVSANEGQKTAADRPDSKPPVRPKIRAIGAPAAKPRTKV
ncbi:MAG TPA: hypothetical protein DEB40_12605 [Elusimicrobia bacterium]|nr:hypothetical protein [Elusimicrobiota bacterium]HBT62574.1 hypothetical protein [Elusimicrobiota bacterium]